MRLFASAVALSGLIAWAGEERARSADERLPVQLGIEHSRVRIVGKLYHEFGAVITIEGRVRNGPSKGDSRPELIVQRIGRRLTSEEVVIKLEPFAVKWGESLPETDERPGVYSLPKLEEGTTYRMRGFETGVFVGIPDETLRAVPGVAPQGGLFGFVHEFVVHRAEAIDAISFSPALASEQAGQVEGVAKTERGQALLDGGTWAVVIDAARGWPPKLEGQKIEATGKFKPTAVRGVFKLVDGRWKQVPAEVNDERRK